MSVRTPRFLLIGLACALAWGLPAEAETSAPPLCAAGVAPPAEIAFGTPGSQPAQTCPCLLDFCAQAGVRCSFTGCGFNNCCAYTCVCDLSCTSGSTPGNTCRFLIPNNCLCGNGVAESDEDCDGTDLRGQTCVSRGFEGGTLGCTSLCTFDTSGCQLCGDGTCEGSEDCESCSLDCDSRTKGNPSLRFCCGNGIAEPAEGPGCAVCDGNC